MNKTTTMITIILLLCAITAQGIPLPGTQARCLCPHTSSELINPKLIKSLKYIPKGSHCETLEIIVIMKNGMKLCVSPDAQWLKIIIKAKKGIPIPGIQGRCKCIRTTANHFDPKLIRSIKYIPRGSHCVATEIIVTMKNGKKLCVNPKVQWMKNFIKAIKVSGLQN
ncbi:interleukin-8-like [Rhincodon typus]|uniref:interleukin-8-like n=1 Tax=Rhincodon typus TaxID=259920 RepID=UPI00202EB5C3|nr:interleukin-8-like [Rhincodon typus]